MDRVPQPPGLRHLLRVTFRRSMLLQKPCPGGHRRSARNAATARRPSSLAARIWTLWPAPVTMTSRPRGASAASRRAHSSGVDRSWLPASKEGGDRRQHAPSRGWGGRRGHRPVEALLHDPVPGRRLSVERPDAAAESRSAARGQDRAAGGRAGSRAPQGKRQSPQSALACRPWLSSAAGRCSIFAVAARRSSSPERVAACGGVQQPRHVDSPPEGRLDDAQGRQRSSSAGPSCRRGSPPRGRRRRNRRRKRSRGRA